MEHKLKLQETYYNYMKNGTKQIELRLYDEKRKLINVSDIIKFYKEPNLDEYFEARVVELLRYGNFKDLIDDCDIELLASKDSTKEELLSDLEKYYSKDKQSKYGVVGIRIEIISK